MLSIVEVSLLESAHLIVFVILLIVVLPLVGALVIPPSVILFKL